MKKVIYLISALSMLSAAENVNDVYSQGYQIYNDLAQKTSYSCFKDYECTDSLGTVSSDAANKMYSPFCALMDGNLTGDALFSNLDVLIVTGNATVTSNIIILGGDGGDGGEGDEVRSRSPMIIGIQVFVSALEMIPMMLTGYRWAKTGKKYAKELWRMRSVTLSSIKKASENIAERAALKSAKKAAAKANLIASAAIDAVEAAATEAGEKAAKKTAKKIGKEIVQGVDDVAIEAAKKTAYDTSKEMGMKALEQQAKNPNLITRVKNYLRDKAALLLMTAAENLPQGMVDNSVALTRASNTIAAVDAMPAEELFQVVKKGTTPEDILKITAGFVADAKKNSRPTLIITNELVAVKADNLALLGINNADTLARNVGNNADDLAQLGLNNADTLTRNVGNNADDLAQLGLNNADTLTRNVADDVDNLAQLSLDYGVNVADDVDDLVQLALNNADNAFLIDVDDLAMLTLDNNYLTSRTAGTSRNLSAEFLTHRISIDLNEKLAIEAVEDGLGTFTLRNIVVNLIAERAGKTAPDLLTHAFGSQTDVLAALFVIAAAEKTLIKTTNRLLGRSDARTSLDLQKMALRAANVAYQAARGKERRDRFVNQGLFYGGGGGGGGFGWANGIGNGGGAGGAGYRSTISADGYMTLSGNGGNGSYGAGGGGGGACYDTATAYWIYNKAGNGGAAAWFAGGGGGGASGVGTGLADWPEGDGFGGNGANGRFVFTEDSDSHSLALYGGGGGGGGMRAANMVLSIHQMILELAIDLSGSITAFLGGKIIAERINLLLKLAYWGLLQIHQTICHGKHATVAIGGSGGGKSLKMFQLMLLTPFPYLPNSYDVAANIHASRSVSNGLIGQVGGDGAQGATNIFRIKNGETKIKSFRDITDIVTDAGYLRGSETYSSNASGGGGGGGVNSPGGNAIQQWESGASGGGGGGSFPYTGGHNISHTGSNYGSGGWGGDGGSLDTYNVPITNSISVNLNAIKGGHGGRGYCGGGGGTGGGWVVVKNGVTLNFGSTVNECILSNVLAQSNSPQRKFFVMNGGSAGENGSAQGGAGGNGGGVMVINGTVNVNPGYSFLVSRPNPPSHSSGKSGGYVLINSEGKFCLQNGSKTSCDIELLAGGTLFVNKLALSFIVDEYQSLSDEIHYPIIFGYNSNINQKINIKLQGKLIYGPTQFNFNAINVPVNYQSAYLFSVIPDNAEGIGKIPFNVWNICCGKNEITAVTHHSASPVSFYLATQTATYLSNCPNIKTIKVNKVQLPDGTFKYGYLDLTGLSISSSQSLSVENGGTIFIPDSLTLPGSMKIHVNDGVLETNRTQLGVFLLMFALHGSYKVKTNKVLDDSASGISSPYIPPLTNVVVSTWQINGGTEDVPQTGKNIRVSRFKNIEVYGYFNANEMELRSLSNFAVMNQTFTVKENGFFDISGGIPPGILSRITFEDNSVLVVSGISTIIDNPTVNLSNVILMTKNNLESVPSNIKSLMIAGPQTNILNTVKPIMIIKRGSINISKLIGSGPVTVSHEGKIIIDHDYTSTQVKDITVKSGGIVEYNATTGPVNINDIFSYLKISDGIFQTNVMVNDTVAGIGNPDIVSNLATWYINAGSGFEQTALKANQFATIRVLSASVLNASDLIMEAGKSLIIDSGATLKLNQNKKLTIFGQLYLKNDSIIEKPANATIDIRSGATICSDRTDFSATPFSNLTFSNRYIVQTNADVTAGFGTVDEKATAWYINNLAQQTLTQTLISKMPRNIHVQGILKLQENIEIPNNYFLHLNQFSDIKFGSNNITIQNGGGIFVSKSLKWNDIKSKIIFESNSQFVTDMTTFSFLSRTPSSFENVNQIGTLNPISDSSSGVSYQSLPISINTWNIYAPYSRLIQFATELLRNTRITTINVGVFDDGISPQSETYAGYLDASNLNLNANQTLNILKGGTLYIPDYWRKTTGTINVKSGAIIAVNDVSLVSFQDFIFDSDVEGPILQLNSSVVSAESTIESKFKKIRIACGSLTSPYSLSSHNVLSINDVMVTGGQNSGSFGCYSANNIRNIFGANKRLTVLFGGVLSVSSINDLNIPNSRVILKDGAIVNLKLHDIFSTKMTLLNSGLSAKFDFDSGSQIIMTSNLVGSFEPQGTNKFSTWYINTGTESLPQTLEATVNASYFSNIVVLSGAFLKMTGASLGGDVSILVQNGGTILMSGADPWPVNLKMEGGSNIRQYDVLQTSWYDNFKKQIMNVVNTYGVVSPPPSNNSASTDVVTPSQITISAPRVVEGNQVISIPKSFSWPLSGTIQVRPNGMIETDAEDLSGGLLSNAKLEISYGSILKTNAPLLDGIHRLKGILRIPDRFTQWHIGSLQNAQSISSLTDSATKENKTALRYIRVLNLAKLNVADTIVPNGLKLEFEGGSNIVGSNLHVYGELFLPINHNFSAFIVKRDGILKTNRTNITFSTGLFESGAILSTIANVTTFSHNYSSVVWNIANANESPQTAVPGNAPSIITATGAFRFRQSHYLRLNQGARLDASSTSKYEVNSGQILFFDKFFDVNSLIVGVIFKAESTFATNRKDVDFIQNSRFVFEGDNRDSHIFQSHQIISDTATGIGSIPCGIWKICSNQSLTASKLAANSIIKQIIISSYEENGITVGGFLNGLNLRIGSGQSIIVESGAKLYLPKNIGSVSGLITIQSGGILMLDHDSNWPSSITLESGSKISQRNRINEKPTWFDNFVAYLSGIETNPKYKVNVYTVSSFADNSKITKLTTPAN